MNILEFNDYQLYVSGDIHGEFKTLLHDIKRHRLHHTVIVIAGDVGLGFNSLGYYKTTLNQMNNYLNEHDIFLICVRGNHDDPSYFNEDKLEFSNIKPIPDYTILKTKDYTTLCIGGAISLDRSWRKNRELVLNKYNSSHKKKLYWENEPFVFNEKVFKEFEDNKVIVDSIITHVCNKTVPKMHFNYDEVEYWSASDPFLKEDIELENKMINNLTQSLNTPIKFWASGHIHVSNYFTFNGTTYLQLADDKRIVNVSEQLTNLNNDNHRKKKGWKLSYTDIFNENKEEDTTDDELLSASATLGAANVHGDIYTMVNEAVNNTRQYIDYQIYEPRIVADNAIRVGTNDDLMAHF